MKRSIKTLIALAFLYLVYLFIKVFFLRKILAGARSKAAVKDAGNGQKAGRAAKRPAQNAEETVLDPVCGRYVPVSGAVTAGSPDKTHYFCSEACREAFMADTGRYVS